jgi:hypothetical protein
MAGTFTVNGANTTIKFEYTALTTTILSIVGSAAEYLWNHGYGDHGTVEIPILFTSLTNQEKLNLVDTHLKQVVIGLANTFKSVKAQDIARAVEEAAKYEL